jgi:3-deoxy-D-manno-octulosonic-acid transferase
MMNLYDIAYALGLVAGAPYWLLVGTARKKVLRALRQRMGDVAPRSDTAPAIMIHAVSLGEMNATRALVAGLASARPDLRFIVSTTTETGWDRGRELYGTNDRITLIRYPLDFSSAIARVLDRLRPAVVALMELEVWPNFLLRCLQRDIPVVLLNGRLTEKSFRNYRRGGPVVWRMFRRLAMICAQDESYADRFRTLGAAAERVRVTGTMKFDTAAVAERVSGDDGLAAAVGLQRDEPIWVCGSTGPGEEQLILEEYRRLLREFPRLRLVIVPRKPERFDEVAGLIESTGFLLVRRSTAQTLFPAQQQNPIILGDTMGELRTFYSLATVVLVGRTLVDLGQRQHGSDMIEPAALAKPTVVGPFTGNFAEPMNAFRAAGAMREISTPRELGDAVASLLRDNAEAIKMGQLAQEVVRQNQGATERHVRVILEQLQATPADLISSVETKSEHH